MAIYSDFLFTPVAGVMTPWSNVWVRLVNNDTGTAYVSDAATVNGTGKFTFTVKPPGGSYTVYTGPTNVGAWTGTGETGRVIGYGGSDDIFAGPPSSDNTSMMQAAFNAINTAGGGEYVLGYQGTYIATALTIYPNTTLRILAGVTLKLKNGSNSVLLKFPTQNGPINNVSLFGPGTIDGNSANQTGGFAVVNFQPSDAVNGSIDGLTIRDLTVKNCWGNGIYISEFQGGSGGSKEVENCTLDNYGVGTVAYGVYLDYAPSAVVDHCTFRNSNGRDACVLGHAGKYRFINNIIYDSGVNYPFADDSTIAFNIIGVTVAGEGINNDSNTANRVRIIDNWVNASPSAQYGGIRCVGADCTVADNYVTVTAANATTKGIMVQGAGARIHDNRIVGVAGAGSFGYGIDDEANGNWIAHDNYITGPFAVGIQLENDDIDVHDNKIDGPLIGVQLLNSASSGHTNLRNNVHDNIFLNNATLAIDPQNQLDPSNRVYLNSYSSQYKTPILNTVAAAVASIAALTTPNDNQKHVYQITGTVTITTLGSGSINLQVAYTDDSNAARTCSIPLCPENGAFAAAANTADAWKGSVVIAVQPNTSITIKTAGTFTGCTYNCSGQIQQLL